MRVWFGTPTSSLVSRLPPLLTDGDLPIFTSARAAAPSDELSPPIFARLESNPSPFPRANPESSSCPTAARASSPAGHHLGLVMGWEIYSSYGEDRTRLGLNRKSIHFLLSLEKGRKTLWRGPRARTLTRPTTTLSITPRRHRLHNCPLVRGSHQCRLPDSFTPAASFPSLLPSSFASPHWSVVVPIPQPASATRPWLPAWRKSSSCFILGTPLEITLILLHLLIIPRFYSKSWKQSRVQNYCSTTAVSDFEIPAGSLLLYQCSPKFIHALKHCIYLVLGWKILYVP
jgi:hypothetical protein